MPLPKIPFGNALINVSLQVPQFCVLAFGFTLIYVGFALLAHHVAVTRPRPSWRRITEFAIMGMAAGFTGALTNIIQVELSSFGSVVSLFVGGMMGGFLATGAALIAQLIAEQSPSLLKHLGSIIVVVGLLIEAVQIALLAMAPGLP